MKMLLFDYRDSEEQFFAGSSFPDFEITFYKSPLNEGTYLSDEELTQTDVINVFTTSNLTKKVLSGFKNLRVIATRSNTFSHIDLDYCIKQNIAVINVEPFGNVSVAEYTITLILALNRNLLGASEDFRAQKINYKNYEGRLLNTLTIGIVGCGSAGSVVAKMSHNLGMKVKLCSYMKNPELEGICDYAEMDELLSTSDIITLHLPYTGENYHMIGANEFEKMKDGVIIINTARGELLDISALYNNLTSGKVRGAGLDVLECEYLSTHPDELALNIQNSETHCVKSALLTRKLFEMKNVIITPHIAFNTVESVNRLLEETFNGIRDYNKGMHTNRVC